GEREVYTPKHLKPRAQRRKTRARTRSRTAQSPAQPWQAVTAYLEQLRFKRLPLGGVDEVDVWRKIETLNGLYEDVIRAERVRYDALLERQRREGWWNDG
ncbi:MAG: hypothetical protein Q4D31_08205, partial [Eubacteriales bacterium]|nr:hypothetical protein [Eubacteriales bacterium]